MSNRPRPRTQPTRLLLAALAVLATTAAPPAGAQPPSTGKHMLYRVQTPRNTVYLLGSIHLATPDLFPLPAPVERAFDEAERVVFEADPDSLAARAGEMVARGTYTGGRTLKGELSPGTWALLEGRLGPQVAQVGGLEPWLLALAVLPGIEYQKLGIRPEHGIDAYFHRRTREAGKAVGSLESVEFQLGLFDGFTPAEQDAFLRTTLESLGGVRETMARMIAAWKAGDEAAIHALFRRGFAGHPSIEARLGSERHARWLPQLEAMLGGSGDVLVVVGAGHLAGPGSVVELLRRRGHRVEQL